LGLNSFIEETVREFNWPQQPQEIQHLSLILKLFTIIFS
jgi:hypothetical protein